MVTAFFPGLADALFGVQTDQEFRTSTTLFIYSWIALTMLIAWLARNIEGTRSAATSRRCWSTSSATAPCSAR